VAACFASFPATPETMSDRPPLDDLPALPEARLPAPRARADAAAPAAREAAKRAREADSPRLSGAIWTTDGGILLV
jgi:hypothetical protein